MSIELVQYDESPTINPHFSQDKIARIPDNLEIPSLHFYQLKKVTQILFKLGEGEDIPKYYEPTPGVI